MKRESIRKLLASMMLTGICLLVVVGHAFAQEEPANAANTDASEPGVLITKVRPGSAAAEAGLLRGDIVLAINEQEVNNAHELHAAITSYQAGEQATLKILRGGEEQTLDVTFAPRDPTAFLGVTPLQDDAPSDHLIWRQEVMPPGGMHFMPGAIVSDVIQLSDGMVFTRSNELPPGMALPPLAGVQVVMVEPGSPADDAGIEAGVTIVALDGEEIQSLPVLVGALAQHKPGDSITLTIRRTADPASESEEITVKLGAQPNDPQAAYLGIQAAPTVFTLATPHNAEATFFAAPVAGGEWSPGAPVGAEDQFFYEVAPGGMMAAPGGRVMLRREMEGDVIIYRAAAAPFEHSGEPIIRHFSIMPGNKVEFSAAAPAHLNNLPVEVEIVRENGGAGGAGIARPAPLPEEM